MGFPTSRMNSPASPLSSHPKRNGILSEACSWRQARRPLENTRQIGKLTWWSYRPMGSLSRWLSVNLVELCVDHTKLLHSGLAGNWPSRKQMGFRRLVQFFRSVQIIWASCSGIPEEVKLVAAERAFPAIAVSLTSCSRSSVQFGIQYVQSEHFCRSLSKSFFSSSSALTTSKSNR